MNVERPEYVVERIERPTDIDISIKRSALAQFLDREITRKAAVLLLVAITWELYVRIGDVNALLFPGFLETCAALWELILSGEIFRKAYYSFRILAFGYPIGILLAAALIVLASSTRIGRDFLGLITSIFQPLPAIALLPLATIWFGFGTSSLVFVTVHSIVWAVALSTVAGFAAVGRTMVMVGENYGVTGIKLIRLVLVPAALPSILTGLRIAWAFAWRTLIGAEVIFGAVSGEGGLGGMVFENSDWLRTDAVFATLVVIILIGLAVENLVFINIEKMTVRKWQA